MLSFCKKFTRKEEGASMVEYGLLLALVAVVSMAALGTVGTKVSAMFTAIAASL